ncbi:phytanoyl-CoA dioxygenase family protein [Parendozoicomonas haliclonae]|uniref:1-deoxypentalenic acid 11-beta-hydroxylase n=1 Tax=Parendozoicomonas haliclonae TaxID=1960125 RepID=A0A1X7AP16_9GAMM|nr:phytanoyl-CoA dioxygenase family protein [Parendozoicomonas haliclonae]SMA50061.1 1-deoxypentalenic acid 11-beta-hydroxylase [Parendozoicomonas haliclonae]
MSESLGGQTVATGLHDALVQQYRERGYLCPLPVFSLEEAAELRGLLEQAESSSGGRLSKIELNKTYLIQEWADRIVHHPAVLDAVESLIGPDILCYMTNLFIKEPGTGNFVSMHQDAAYWGVDADDVVTAWVALSVSDEQSGCMKVIPGTHTRDFRQENTYDKDNLLTRGQTIAEALDDSQSVFMALQPGEMSLHHFRIVHGSEPNRAEDRRIGLAIRYVSAKGKKIGQPESALLVRGQSYGHFIEEKRWTTLSSTERKLQHNQALSRQIRNLFEPDEDTALGERLRLRVMKTVFMFYGSLRGFGIRLGLVR